MLDSVLMQRVWDLTAGWTIRRGERADADAFVSLYNETYPKQITAEYYLWQFFSESQPAVCLLAQNGEQVGACYGARLLRYCLGADREVALGVDLVLSPAARNTGLFWRLEEEMLAAIVSHGAAWIYAAPNDAAYGPRVRELGWKRLPEKHTFLAATSAVPPSSGLSFRRIARFGAEADRINSGFQAGHPDVIMAHRDSQYLNWRFCDSPWNHYDVYIAERWGVPFGYVVTKVYEDSCGGQIIGDIVDMLWREEDPDGLTEMLRFSLAHFHSIGVATAAMWLETGTALDLAGVAAGFVQSAQNRHFCWRTVSTTAGCGPDVGRWFLTMADSERF